MKEDVIGLEGSPMSDSTGGIESLVTNLQPGAVDVDTCNVNNVTGVTGDVTVDISVGHGADYSTERQDDRLKGCLWRRSYLSSME